MFDEHKAPLLANSEKQKNVLIFGVGRMSLKHMCKR
jgi:hypothetical protein